MQCRFHNSAAHGSYQCYFCYSALPISLNLWYAVPFRQAASKPVRGRGGGRRGSSQGYHVRLQMALHVPREIPRGMGEKKTGKKQGQSSARKREMERKSRWREPNATMALSTRDTRRSFLRLVRKELRVHRELRVRSRGIALRREPLRRVWNIPLPKRHGAIKP